MYFKACCRIEFEIHMNLFKLKRILPVATSFGHCHQTVTVCVSLLTNLRDTWRECLTALCRGFKINIKPGVICMTLVLALGRQRQEDRCEFEANLVNVVSSWIASDT